MFSSAVLVYLRVGVRSVANSKNVVYVDICDESVEAVEPSKTVFGCVRHIRARKITLKRLQFVVHFSTVE